MLYDKSGSTITALRSLPVSSVLRSTLQISRVESEEQEKKYKERHYNKRRTK